MYGAVVLLLIVLFGEETWVYLFNFSQRNVTGNSRLYDRALKNPKPLKRPKSTLRYKFETLLGVAGARMAKYRYSWKQISLIWFDMVWRPHIFGILFFEVCGETWKVTRTLNAVWQALLFGFSIGINVRVLEFNIALECLLKRLTGYQQHLPEPTSADRIRIHSNRHIWLLRDTYSRSCSRRNSRSLPQ